MHTLKKLERSHTSNLTAHMEALGKKNKKSHPKEKMARSDHTQG